MEGCMKKKVILLLSSLFVMAGYLPGNDAVAQNWAKVYQTSSFEIAQTADQLFDGTVIVAGDTLSPGLGGRDMWVVRVDLWGNIIWQNNLGGADDDAVLKSCTSRDGGIVVSGWTKSVSSGNLTQMVVVKMNNAGAIEWQNTYDSTAFTYLQAHAILQTPDEGYLFLAKCWTETALGMSIIKIDALGALIWQKYYEASYDVVPSEIAATADGGQVIIGSIMSASALSGLLVVKLDAAGDIDWQKSYTDGSNIDGVSVLQTGDGGYLAAGNKEIPTLNQADILALKLDASGAIEWQKTYGGFDNENLTRVIQTEDGGYILAGETASFGQGWSDIWSVKVNNIGTVEWQKTFGSANAETLKAVSHTIENGLLLAGGSTSFGTFEGDALVVKLDQNGSSGSTCSFITTSNASVTTPALVVNTIPAVLEMVSFSSQEALLVDHPASLDLNTFCYSCADDPYEKDDSCAVVSAGMIYESQRQTHNFWDLTDDWLQFHACQDQSYTISTSNLGMDADTVLELYDDACSTVLAYDDDGAEESKASMLEWSAPVNGTYYLRVTPKDGLVSNIGAIGNFSYYDVLVEGPTNPCSTWARTYSPATLSRPAATRSVSESSRNPSDSEYVVVPAQDSGFLTAGERSESIWIMKMDSLHAIEWEQTLGGAGQDKLHDLKNVDDGGYILIGSTTSSGMGAEDGWVIALDHDGSIQWEKTYGTVGSDVMVSVEQTTDDGFIVAGSSGGDIWLVKLSAAGGVTWQYLYGGPGTDTARTVRQTSEGDYLVAGSTTSFGAGGTDIVIMKIDPDGTVVWSKTYGGLEDDSAADIIQTPDRGYLLIGTTYSFGSDSPLYSNIWSIKLDYRGQVEWQQIVGGSAHDVGTSITNTNDGGFILCGYSQQLGGDYDYYLMKGSWSGVLDWQKLYGATDDDYALAILSLNDTGYFVSGYSASIEGDQPFLLKIPSSGELNSSCPIIAEAGLTLNPTAAIIGFPSPTRVVATATVLNTTVSGIVTSSEQTEMCNLSLPLEVSPVGASQYLVFLDKSTLFWEEATLSGSDLFNVYRADRADLINGFYGTCLAYDLVDHTLTEPDNPGPGECWFYLVSGTNILGEGPLGADSQGNARLNVWHCP